MPYGIREWNKFDSLICQIYSHSLFGKVFFDELSAIRLVKLKVSEDNIVRVLLFGKKGFGREAKLKITNSSISFIKESKILEEPLFYWFIPFQHSEEKVQNDLLFSSTFFCISIFCNLYVVKNSICSSIVLYNFCFYF